MRIFSVPNGCSTVSRRARIAFGFSSSRLCAASRMCSCSPTWNAPLVACRTFRLQRAIRAGVRPIAPHHLAVLLVRHVIGQLLASRTAIDILGGVVDEVLLAETTIRLRA